MRWLAVALVPALVLAGLRWDWTPSASSGDYAQYLLHAQAIVDGRAYGDIGYIYHPAASLIGPAILPPGLPLTLAPIVAIGGVHSPLVKLVILASIVLFAGLAAWRLARDVEPWQAALGAALAAYAVTASMGAIAPLSDPGFAALIWATILVADAPGAWSWRRVAGVTALGFAVLGYRMAGVALIPALLLYALVQRRHLGARPFIPALVWSVAGLAALVTGLAGIPFLDRLARSLGDIGEHLATFARQYRIALFDAQLYPFANNAANDAYHLVASLLAAVGLAALFWRTRRSFLVAFAAAYVALLLVAPVAEPRYAWPLYPLIGTALVVAVGGIVRRVAAGWPRQRVALVAAAPVVLVLLLTLKADARRTAPPSLVRHADAIALFDWLQERRDSGDTLRVAFNNPRVLTLESGVPAMGLAPRTPPGQLAVMLDGRITHLVVQRAGVGPTENRGPAPCVQRTANELPALFPSRFTREYANNTFEVYRLLPGAALPADSTWHSISWTEC